MNGLPVEDHAKLLVELWKQTIAVQQHFNDLSWRIRGLALTALTFTLGAAAVAAQKAIAVHLFGVDLQLSFVITFVGLVLWCSFYYVDRKWYHPLLKGAVQHGEALEQELKTYFPRDGLTETISKVSPYTTFSIVKFKKINIHSGKKLQRFYGVVVGLLLVFMAALQLGAPSSKAGVADSGTDTDTDTDTPSPVSSSPPAPTSQPAPSTSLPPSTPP